MSKKRYYYFKLSADFFKRLVIKKMKSMPGGGDILSTYIALIAYCTEEEGVLHYQGVEETLAKELAMALDCEERISQSLLIFLEAHGLLEALEGNRYLLVDSIKMIGSETDAAERMRRLREERKTLPPDSQSAPDNKEKSPPLSGAERIKRYRENKKLSQLTHNSSVTDVTRTCNECNDDTVTCNENETLLGNEDVTMTPLHGTLEMSSTSDCVTERTLFEQNDVTFEQCSLYIDIELEKEGGKYAHTYARTHESVPESLITLDDKASSCCVTSVTKNAYLIEDFIVFRLSGGGINHPYAFEESIRKNLMIDNSSERKRFDEWCAISQHKWSSEIEELYSLFLNFGYKDRIKCRMLAEDFTQMYGYDISATLFEIIFLEVIKPNEQEAI